MTLFMLLAAGLLALSSLSGGTASDLVTVTYTASDETIVNPERGFFHQSSECQNDGTTFTAEALRRYREVEKISLVRCVFYLDKVLTLEGGQIARLEAHLQTARQQGIKLIVRFAYTQDELHSPVSPNDVPMGTVQSHITQLAPTLRSNSDVILAVEAGFVGAYGEGAYSEHFGDIGLISDAQWSARKAIVDRLLDVLPDSVPVLVRTPEMKQRMYSADLVAATEADVAARTARGRVGYFNDCFLRNASDAGTYRTAGDRAFVAAETRFVPMGGETCAPSERSGCEAPEGRPSALTELEAFQWSFLNQDYNRAILDSWTRPAGRCVEEIRQRLGYRFTLVSTQAPPTVRRGDPLHFRMVVRNTGWAGTINTRPIVLELHKITARRVVLRLPLGTAADWKAGSQRLRSCAPLIPLGAPPGRYRMFLRLPDPAARLAAQPEFSIRLANAGLWREASGLNDLLRSVDVLPAVASPRQERPSVPCTSSDDPPA